MAPYNTSGWRTDLAVNLTTVLHGPMVRHWDMGLKPVVTGWILSVASCLIIFTNLLVAAALLQLIRKKGSQSWCFVLNLALADTLVGLAITGIASDDLSYNTTALINGFHGAVAMTSPSAQKCLFRMMFVIAPSTASILSMFLISLDRYTAIKLPLRYSQLVGKGTVAGSLVVVWVLSLTIGFLPGLVKGLQQASFGGFCTFFSVIRPGGMMVVFCALFFPVLSIFLFFYLDILKIACFHQKQIRQARQAGSRLPQGNYRYWSHVKALRTVALLVGCFTLSWCPFFVVCAVQFLCEACELLRFLENDLWLLGLSNSLINPLVYACWQREVRLQLGALFFCKSSLLHPGSSDITERCQTQRHANAQTIVTGSEPLDPTSLPNLMHQEAHVPLSNSTSL